MTSSMADLNHPLKYTFGYATGFVFLLGIMIYLYLLITDHLEDPNQHSTEEKVWIYFFLATLVAGFMISYYSITCSIYCVNANGGNESSGKQGFSFGGSRMNIPCRPSSGQQNKIRFSRFMV